MAKRLTWGQTVLLGGGQAWLRRVTRLRSVALWAKASPPVPSLPSLECMLYLPDCTLGLRQQAFSTMFLPSILSGPFWQTLMAA